MVSIGEFSRISKVTTKTLRYYDEIGLLAPAHVNSGTGYRYYDVDQLKTILLINRLKAYHFTLEEIADVLAHPGDGRLLFTLIRQKQRMIRERMDVYQSVLSQLDHDAHSLERGIDIMSYFDDIPVRLVDLPTMNILFIRERMNVNDFGKHMARLYQTITKEKLTPTGPPMALFHQEEFDPEDYDMEIAVPVKEAVTGTRDFVPGLCAAATLKGPYTELTALYAKIREWMEREGYAINGVGFEIYKTDPAEVKPEDNITEVYVQVKK